MQKKELIQSFENILQSDASFQEKEHANRMINRLKTGICNIAFAGTFSAGKSSLINALVGKKIMPAKAIPTTSTGIFIRYGKERGKVFYESGKNKKILFPSFSLFNKKKKNEKLDEFKKIISANQSGVTHAIFHTKSSILRSGAHFIDIPGIDSLFKFHNQNIDKSLLYTDVIIYLIDASKPLSKKDIEVLNNYKNEYSAIIFVITKSDTIDESEQDLETLAAEIKNTIRKSLEIQEPQLYIVSAKDYFSGLKVKNRDLIKASRIPDLKKELKKYIQKNSNSLLLKSVQLKAGDIITRSKDWKKRLNKTVNKKHPFMFRKILFPLFFIAFISLTFYAVSSPFWKSFFTSFFSTSNQINKNNSIKKRLYQDISKVKNRDKDGNYYRQYADYYMLINNKNTALSLYKKAIRMQPENLEVLFNLSQFKHYSKNTTYKYLLIKKIKKILPIIGGGLILFFIFLFLPLKKEIPIIFYQFSIYFWDIVLFISIMLWLLSIGNQYFFHFFLPAVGFPLAMLFIISLLKRFSKPIQKSYFIKHTFITVLMSAFVFALYRIDSIIELIQKAT